MATCPASQDIPSYLYYTAKGDYARARKVILATNPFPNVQGMVCDHLCQSKCTRINYDNPLLIREIKRFVIQTAGNDPCVKNRQAQWHQGGHHRRRPVRPLLRHFLALQGFAGEIFESKTIAGGWASDAIPSFRLDDTSIKKDIDAILSLGVTIHYNPQIDSARFPDDLRIRLSLHRNRCSNRRRAGDSRRRCRRGDGQPGILKYGTAWRKLTLGHRVAIIGGGNSAMDAARTAKRLVGPDGEVSVLYRRTRREMPAAPEEIQAMLDEGINLVELTAPECMLVEDGRVKSNLSSGCNWVKRTAVAAPDPIKIDGSEFELNAETVISAIGQRVDLDFFPEKS